MKAGSARKAGGGILGDEDLHTKLVQDIRVLG